MSQTIFISNRLPITVSKKNKQITYKESIGGLATGLKGYHQHSDALWIGWPGIPQEKLTKSETEEMTSKLKNTYKSYPVGLSQHDLDLYYEGFSNKTIWPLFHYFQEKTEHDIKTWERYQKVNQKFFEATKPFIEEDSMIWIHDYQLMLLPKLIRQAFPYVKIGFFLHIPFPSYEIFRLLIWKDEILEGLLGSDLIGFHTYDYVRHFLSSVRHIKNINHNFYKLQYNDRNIAVDAFPMGIDYTFFNEHPAQIKKQNDMKIILSVDRLDYTKGIVERLNAYQTFLEIYPKYRKKVKLHLIVAPSRAKLESYDRLHQMIEKRVSEINGKFGNFEWMPIWYLYQSFTQDDLITYYKTSDILLVTPLRDGMNLIAKEYIASRNDFDGMLIISETAGAASELSEAMIINPNDAQSIAHSIKNALEMTRIERIQRNKVLHERLKTYTVQYWASDFMERLKNLGETHVIDPTTDDLDLFHLIKTYKKGKNRLFLLDYDGTLMSFKKTPAEAKPTRSLKKLILELAKPNNHHVVIISGRDHETLEAWFHDLPIDLVGDHGLWIKKQGEAWKKTLPVDDSWKKDVLTLLDKYIARIPGAFIEEKSHAVAMHYRAAEPEMMHMKLQEIKDALFTLKGKTTLEIQEGHKVIEIKDQRINKGIAAQSFLQEAVYDFILVAGDDTTDEDMFQTLNDAYMIKIGYGISKAHYRVESVKKFIDVLNALRDAK
ncbi:MAG: bifunctional alpha,alpha-trehalose-phosphate synthase (UDP-forming)/trehalose-phosphatase [Tenericutes bacterium HGW-Tenericutes-6]|nr:MAG: bifunctional alpha,alpha-trehalose-phosphate synthase (UDP-forming)/trehalose-phosphatase [Tenericutes bacterium HGW-Tenericutes-6]